MHTPFGNTPTANAYNTYGAALGNGNSYMLDSVSGAKMALSVRRLSYGYAGNYTRLRRGSDNAEVNVTSTSQGFVNGQAILDNGQLLDTWLAGSQGYGRAVYDQSGNGLNADQNTAVNQFVLNPAFIGTKPSFTGISSTDCFLNYSTGINTYLFGAGKQFTMHLLAKTNVQLSGDFRPFYHLNSSGSFIKGFTVQFTGAGISGGYKISIAMGDLVGTAGLSTVNSFPNTKPIHIIIKYDGTENSAWLNRVKILVNGNPENLTQTSSLGPFPVDLAQPTTLPRCWAPASTGLISGLCELIVWDRILTSTETDFISKSTKKEYGL